MALFLVSALLLFLLKDVTCQILPYTTITNRKDNSNNITLRCIGQFGIEVPGASFYRNSQPITNSSCLTAYPTGSSSVLNVTLASQECDGYFSCGVNGTLSEPKPLYACPRKNVSANKRTEVIEEGTNFLLTCDFPPSPIKQYRTVWHEGQGSLTTDIQSTPELQSYTLLSAHPNKYSCQVQPMIDKCTESYNSIIEIHVKDKYEPPMITKDLNYTRHNSGSGGVFSVSTSGTNLTHKWYKNDKLINRNGAGILAFGNDALRVEDSNGLLRITYEASNVDYDNMTHTTNQTFGLYTNVSQDGSATIALAVLVPIGTLFILTNIILTVIIICIKCKAQASQPKIKSRDSKQEATHLCKECLDKKALKPMEHILLCSSSLVQDCETNYEFLDCLTMMFNTVMHKRNIDDECEEALTKMRNEMEKLMKSRKPQKTGEKMVYDGPYDESTTYDGQHEQDDKIYEQYKKLYDLFDNCIKEAAPDQDKGQNFVN